MSNFESGFIQSNPDNSHFEFKNWIKAPIEKEGGEFERVFVVYMEKENLGMK